MPGVPRRTQTYVAGDRQLGTLGESRGKIILLQRFSYRLLSPSPEAARLHGLDLGADRWTDNGDDIHLVYNSESGATAFIEVRKPSGSRGTALW